MKKNKGTLILSGLGLNCENETAYACKKSGAEKVDVVHTLRFLKGEVKLEDYDFMVFIGGFLDGDHLGSARVGVNRFKYGSSPEVDIRGQLERFVQDDKLVLGICNGFQFLVKLGLLPDETDAFVNQKVSLTMNQNGKFEDRWVHMHMNEKSPSVFTKGIEKMYLPVRHGEGRFVVGSQDTEDYILSNNLHTMMYADKDYQPTDEYPLNPNGSWQNLAGLSNIKGNVFGMMPHPEAYNHYTNHPSWTRMEFQEEDGEGLLLFKNAYRYLNQ